MQIGDLVRVETKHHGTKIALVIEIVEDDFGCDVLVQPLNHPRNILCNPWDVEIINASR